ncbi:hypothetical protein BU17DRAFT_62973 [Hysterangium stoloniferum]|nr:hypothetical protein BU17DRAFT_62973 [Hysterangium stoloniferum]
MARVGDLVIFQLGGGRWVPAAFGRLFRRRIPRAYEVGRDAVRVGLDNGIQRASCLFYVGYTHVRRVAFPTPLLPSTSSLLRIEGHLIEIGINVKIKVASQERNEDAVYLAGSNME